MKNAPNKQDKLGGELNKLLIFASFLRLLPDNLSGYYPINAVYLVDRSCESDDGSLPPKEMSIEINPKVYGVLKQFLDVRFQATQSSTHSDSTLYKDSETSLTFTLRKAHTGLTWSYYSNGELLGSNWRKKPPTISLLASQYDMFSDALLQNKPDLGRNHRYFIGFSIIGIVGKVLLIASIIVDGYFFADQFSKKGGMFGVSIAGFVGGMLVVILSYLLLCAALTESEEVIINKPGNKNKRYILGLTIIDNILITGSFVGIGYFSGQLIGGKSARSVKIGSSIGAAAIGIFFSFTSLCILYKACFTTNACGASDDALATEDPQHSSSAIL